MKKVLFTSNKEDWETPKNLFLDLDREFHFTLDLCASDQNHLLEKYYTKEDDALSKNIENEIVFCNPPYGRSVTGKFVKKCTEAKLAVLLIPARTDTKWFHDFIWKKAEIRFIRGRVHFSNCSDPAPFPSMIVIMKKDL